MGFSRDKKILLGVTGGIAVYKAADLCRQLSKAGYQVRVVMTRGASEFVKPLTFQALSGQPVHTELLDPDAEAGMGHIELAKWPDLILIAPATANLLSLYSQGQASDLLTTLLLATEAPVALAPAMNQAMWQHPMTQNNLIRIQELLGEKCMVWGPAEGEQACGDVGPGRMLEPLEILAEVNTLFEPQSNSDSNSLAGKRVVITAGPTQEAIDPVRYISNHSSGKMGYALARSFLDLGAEVILVSGPVTLAAPEGVQLRNVLSARDMLQAVESELEQQCDIFIASAAVADYRVENVADSKIKKKNGDDLVIRLCQNPDIVATVASREDRPFVVGFAAETNDVLLYAKGKLEKKNLDMVIANDVSQSGIGFNSDRNAVHVIDSNETLTLPEQSKIDLADKLASMIALKARLSAKQAKNN